jgi:hypothetical protein
MPVGVPLLDSGQRVRACLLAELILVSPQIRPQALLVPGVSAVESVISRLITSYLLTLHGYSEGGKA